MRESEAQIKSKNIINVGNFTFLKKKKTFSILMLHLCSNMEVLWFFYECFQVKILAQEKMSCIFFVAVVEIFFCAKCLQGLFFLLHILETSRRE
jgi:hypothetical protein